MSQETRNGFPLSLHYLVFGKSIGGMRRGGGTLARQEEGRAAVLRQIRSLFQVGALGDLTDGQLLERFMTGHKESAEPAFTALVERHGPMVWRVCRRVLTDSHQAEDALRSRGRARKNQRPDTQLRIRAFCPGISAFLADFRVVGKNASAST